MGKRRSLVETRPHEQNRSRGLVSSRQSGRRVEARTYAPPDDLADVIATYWVGEWDLRGQVPHVTELLGDPCLHIAVEEGDMGTESRVVGVWTRLWKRTLEGRGRVFGVKLRAGGTRAFVDVPASRLANTITPLADHFGEDATLLERAILSEAQEIEAFSRISIWLRSHRRKEHAPGSRLAIALVARVAGDPTITTVERLSVVAGLHKRVLERLFFDHVGATPKLVIRRNRLQEVALRIERGEAPSLADLAVELGYTDQAHLSRDFKSATGKTPREFGLAVHG